MRENNNKNVVIYVYNFLPQLVVETNLLVETLFLNRYPSMKEASRQLNVSSRQIAGRLKFSGNKPVIISNKEKTKGYIFSFYSVEETELKVLIQSELTPLIAYEKTRGHNSQKQVYIYIILYL